METNQPLVSVCVPLYNHECFVADCIKSIICQSYENVELIIIDDGSTDKSYDEVRCLKETCANRFSRFELRSRSNKGLCSTINEALDWCRGEYFCVLASDDMWIKTKLKDQVSLFEKLKQNRQRVGVLFGKSMAISASGTVLKEQKSNGFPVYYDFFDVYMGKCYVSAPTAIIDMSAVRLVGGYSNEYIIEDFYMWLAITAAGYRLLVVDDVVSMYRLHESNTHSNLEKMLDSKLKILENFKPSDEIYKLAKKQRFLSNYCYACENSKRKALKLLLSGKVSLFTIGFYKCSVLLVFPRIIFDCIRKLKN